MIDLKIAGPHVCDFCDAREAGCTVLILSEAERDVLHQILEQVAEAAQEERVTMTANELVDLNDIRYRVQPTRKATKGGAA